MHIKSILKFIRSVLKVNWVRSILLCGHYVQKYSFGH